MAESVSMKEQLRPELEHFLSGLPCEELARRTGQRSGAPEAEIASMLTTYINEARVTLDVVGDELERGRRILEVGAGLCLFSLFLRQQGFDVTALEPSIGGFGAFEQAREAILERFPSPELPLLTCTAQDLDRQAHGGFDLIFSNNVVEHIPDWEEALAAMAEVLDEGGLMVHACPNYSVPYEPHYGIPVFRRLPGLSRRLFLPEEADTGVWDSLNFITATQVRRFARSRGLEFRFRPGLLHQAVSRIKSDPLFRQRHQGLVAGIAGMLDTIGLLRLLKYLPAGMATPMIFELCKIAPRQVAD